MGVKLSVKWDEIHVGTIICPEREKMEGQSG